MYQLDPFYDLDDDRYLFRQSMFTTMEECERLAFYQFVEMEGNLPAGKYRERGIQLHEAVAIGLRRFEGPIPREMVKPAWAVIQEYARWVPAVDDGRVLVEVQFRSRLWEGLPVVRGTVDFLYEDEEGARLMLDLKSRSDLKWSKTEQQLRRDLQLALYADGVWGPDAVVKAGHVNATVSSRPKVLTRVVTLTPELRRPVTDRARELAAKVTLLLPRDQPGSRRITRHQVEPTGAFTGRCNMYGGCPLRAECGFADGMEEPKRLKMGKKSLKELMAADPGSSGSEADSKPAEGGSSPPSGAEVPRSEMNARPVVDQSAAEEARADLELGQKLAQQQAAALLLPPGSPSRATGEVPEEEKKAVKGKKASGKKQFVLCVDCYPVKGIEFTLGEDFLAPICDRVASDAGLADYRLIPYTGDGDLASGIREHVQKSGLPECLVLSTQNRAGKVAVEILSPLATLIIRR